MARPIQAPRLEANAAGTFEIRYHDGRSRRRSTGTSDRRQAETVFAEWLLNREKPTVAPRERMTVGEALIRYYNGHIAPHAADKGRQRINVRWLTKALGAHHVNELTDQDVLGYVADRRAGKIGRTAASDGTIRLELGTLRSALAYLVRTRVLAADVVPHIPRPAAPGPREQWLTVEQVDVLLAWFMREDAQTRLSRAHRFVVLALGTAARKGAIEALRWEHVDLTHQVIRYDRQVVRQTKKRRVAAPIPDWLVPYLKRMHDERQGDYVLDSADSIRGAFEWALGKAAKDTGIAAFEGLTRHALRHTAATLALQAGASLWQVAGLLGDNPATVAKTYGHHAQEHVRAAANSWRTA